MVEAKMTGNKKSNLQYLSNTSTRISSSLCNTHAYTRKLTNQAHKCLVMDSLWNANWT